MRKKPGLTQEQLLQKYLEVVAQLPSAPPPVILPENDPLRMQCLCGHYKPIASMPVRNTGLVNFRDNVCTGCKSKDTKKWSTIVCHRCRSVLGQLEPMRDKDGFVFAPGRCYHVARCPVCCVDILQTEIVERVLWLRNHLRKT